MQGKYRGKRIDNGKWVYGWYTMSRYGGPYIMKYAQPYSCDCNDSCDCMADVCKWAMGHEVIPASVGQSTGLKYPAEGQKTEAYSGDLFTHLDRSCGEPMEIVWLDGGWRGCNSDYLFRLTQREMERCTLIGNTIDNPELVEK